MPHDAGHGDLVLGPERRHELFDALPLGGRGGRFFEIPDEADSDSTLVVILVRAAGVRSLNLRSPAEGRLDGSVRHTVAVADHEVVTDPQPGVAALIFVLLLFGGLRLFVSGIYYAGFGFDVPLLNFVIPIVRLLPLIVFAAAFLLAFLFFKKRKRKLPA